MTAHTLHDRMDAPGEASLSPSVAGLWRHAADAVGLALAATVSALRRRPAARRESIDRSRVAEPGRYEDFEVRPDALGHLLRGAVYPHLPGPGRK